MTLDGPHITKAQIFEQPSGHKQPFDRVFQLASDLDHGSAHAGNMPQETLNVPPHFVVYPPVMILFRSEIAPTLGEIDISLSLRMTSKFFLRAPALFNASQTIPAVKAPSPMTTTDVKVVVAVIACYRNAETRRDRGACACPALKMSWGFSSRRQKPLIPDIAGWCGSVCGGP